MSLSLSLTRSNIATFLTCPRRYQLYALERLPWPDYTPTPGLRRSFERGKTFHLLLERFFAGLPVDESIIRDQKILKWWQQFRQHGPFVPPSRRLPEMRLTVPAGSHFLSGRFDLLAIEPQEKNSRIHIFDWKTSRPRSSDDLKTDWQTRLYLAMVAQSGRALLHDDPPFTADHITLTYWYTDDAQHPRLLHYSQEWHDQNWTEILEVVHEIDVHLQQDIWPLTSNWSHCRRCPYQAYCGRWEAGTEEAVVHEEEPFYEIDYDFYIEPHSP